MEWEADIDLGEEGPSVDLLAVSSAQEDLPSSGSKLEDGGGIDPYDGLVSVGAGGEDESEVEVESFDLGGTPGCEEGDVAEPGDVFGVDASFFKDSVKEGDGGLDDELV